MNTHRLYGTLVARLGRGRFARPRATGHGPSNAGTLRASRVGLSLSAVLASALLSIGGARAAEAALAPLDLAALLREADATSPEIRAAESRRAAAERMPSQMEALPDPEAGVAYTNDTITDLTLGSSIMSNLTLSWTQEVPYPGKRRRAGDVARAEIGVMDRMLETARWRVLASVKAIYAELHRIDRTTAILEESRKLLESFLGTARARYESGEGILENVLKARTELTRLEADLAVLAQERRSAAAMLNAAIGRSADAPVGPAEAEARAEVPGREDVERLVLERSPEILSMRAALAREEARVDLAELDLKPDFAWTAAYMFRGGIEPMVMGGFGVRLPAWRRHKQAEAVAQTRHERDAVQHDIRSLEVRTLSEVRDRLARAERASRLIELYGEGILPQARGALDAAAASYAVGRAEFVTLIDDFLTLLRYELDYEAQRAERIESLAALEPLAGESFVHPAFGIEGGPDEHRGERGPGDGDRSGDHAARAEGGSYE